MAFFNPNFEAEKAAQEYIREQLAASGQLDKAKSTYKKDLSASVIRKNIADIERDIESNLRGELSGVEIDPYDNTPRKKVSKEKLMSLTQSTYSNKLLEKLLKASDRTDIDNASLKFQETVIARLDTMSKSLEQLVTNTTKEKVTPAEIQSKEELDMKPTELAKQIAQLSVEGVVKELKTGIMKKMDSSGMGEVMASFFQQFKEMIQEGSFASTIKNFAQEAAINRLPGPYKQLVSQWREDPVKLIQLGINRLAGDRNSVISDLASVFHSGVKPNTAITRKTIDMNAKANFDNKFYTSVTKIIPEQLYKIVAALEGSPLMQFDWEKQEYVDSMAHYAERVEKLEGAMTKGVDSVQSALLYSSDDQILKNRDLAASIVLDNDGKAVRDEDGRVKLKNPSHIRKIISQIITANIHPEDVMYLPADKLMSLDSSIGRGMSKGEAWSTLNTIKAFVHSLSSDDRQDFFVSIMDAKAAVDRREDDGSHDVLSAQDKAAVRAAMAQMTGDAKQWQETLRNSHANIIMSNWSAVGGGVGRGVGRGKKNKYPKSGGVIYDPSKEFQNIDISGLSDEEKGKVIDKLRKAKSKISSGIGIDEDSFGSTVDIRHRDGASGESTPESKYQSQLEMRYRAGMLTEREYNDLSFNPNSMNDANVKDKHDEDIRRLETALEYYRLFDQAGLTADAKAATMGNSKAFWKARGNLSSPEELLKIINPDGTLDTSKLSRFNISFDSSMGDVKDHFSKKARDNNKSTFGGGAVDSVTKSISKIFGDPRIADKAGYALGGATGLAIGKLLKDQGIVQSNKLGYALGAVGMAAMSLESTKRYMKNIFGSDGDVRRDTPDGGKKGYTNKEIFMAKFMTKYLPAIGIGGKAATATLKAFTNLGPIGWAVGLPAAVVTGVIGGAVGSAAVNGLRNLLFKKRDKDDESIWGKIGDFLKDMPGVKKFFALEDDRSDVRIYADTLKQFAHEQSNLAAKAKADGKVATAKGHEMASKKLMAAAEKIMKNIEGNPDMPDDKKIANAQNIVNKVLDEVKSYVKKDDFETLYDAEIDARDRSQEFGSAASQEYFDPNKDMRDRHGTGFESLRAELAEIDGKIDGRNGEIKRESKMADSEYRKDALSGKYGKKQQTYARLWEALSSEDTLDKHLADMMSDYVDANKEATTEATNVFRENGESIQSLIGRENADKLITIMDDYNNGRISKEDAMEQYDAIMQTEDVKKNEQDIKQLMQAKITQDEIMHQMLNFTKEYMKKTTNLQGDDLEIGSINRLKTELQNMSISKRASKGLNDFKNALVKFGSMYWTGDDGDSSEYDLFVSMSDFMSDMETSKSRYSDMNIKPSESGSDSDEDGSGYYSGAGVRSKKGRPQPNKSAKMKDFSHIKLKNGKSIGEIGCAVTSLFNALQFIGIDPPDITTLSDMANDYLTKGGIDHKFFAHLSTRLGYKVEKIETNNQNVRVLIEKHLTKWVRKKSSSVIFLMKNVGVEGNHFVTAEGQIGQQVRINDPETTGLENYPISEISSRIVGIYVISKYEYSKLTKKILSVEDSVKEKFSKVKNVKKKLDNAMDLIKNPKAKLTEIASRLITENSNYEPVMKDGVAAYKTQTIGQDSVFAKMLEKLTKIADNTEESKDEDVVDVRITDDMTLPVKAPDAITARALARYNAFKGGLSKKAASAAAAFKRLTENKDVQHEMKEADKMQDDIAKIAENTSVAQDKTSDASQTEKKSEDKSSFLTDLLMADGLKGLLKNLVKNVGRIAVPLALAGGAAFIANKGFKRVKEGAAQAWGGIKNLNPFTNEDQQAVVDPESGKVIQDANIYDPTASFRHIRDGVNFATGAAKLTSMALHPLDTARRGLEIGKDVFKNSSKVAKVADVGGRVISKVENMAKLPNSKLGKVAGFIISGLQKFFDLLAKNKVVGKLIGGGAFMEKVAGPILGKIQKLLPSILSKAGGEAAKKGAGAFFKGVPFLGQAILLAQAAMSFFNGFQKAHMHLNVEDENAVSTGERIKMGLVKVLYDIGPDLLASLLPPGVSWIALGLIAILRKIITWATVLDWFFPKEEREKKRIKVEGSDKTISEVEKELEAQEKKIEEEKVKLASDENYVKMYESHGVKDTDKLPNGKTLGEFKEDIKSRRENHEKQITNIAEQKQKLQQQYNKVQEKNQQALIMNEAYTLTASDEAKKKKWEVGKSRWKHPRGDWNTMVTSAFGPRNVSGGSKNHRGIDFKGNWGDPVYAAADGIVELTSPNLGKVVIKHPDGTQTRYLHMSKFKVKQGDQVKAGQEIGAVGNIGPDGTPSRAYGNHLHFEVIENGTPVDPFISLGLDPGNFKLGPYGQENEAYLERNKWLTSKATENVLKDNNKEKPEKGGPEIHSSRETEWDPVQDKKVQEERHKQTIVALQSDNARLTAEMKMLNNKLDQVVTYLSQLVNIVGENSNNFMSEAMSGSKII